MEGVAGIIVCGRGSIVTIATVNQRLQQNTSVIWSCNISKQHMESEYVKRTVGVCLSQGLAEVAIVRPPDPIEYLAIWLLKFKANQEERNEVVRLTDSG